MHVENTIALVVVTPLILWGFKVVTRWVTRLIPEGRFKDIVTSERGHQAKPNLASLRRGLK